ncbi:hypothetical protein [Deinococcus aquaedulcis]|uniref:hypothetical protein n=1 Tax=Deinococcus aquaedulcis TaxID=2840455 RepID=UPI001C838B20|nr:hypothetical protein [Deinococcus aquaedulcis]
MTPISEAEELTALAEAWTDDAAAYRSWAQAIQEMRLANMDVTLTSARRSPEDRPAPALH